MNAYFVDSEQPIFLSFNLRIENSATDLDLDLLIQELETNFQKEEQENWLKFWQTQGEEEVLQQWNKKYKIYLKVEDCPTESESEKADNKLEETNVCEADCVSNARSWEGLWESHRQQIYWKQHSLFTTIFYKYFLDLVRSCESAKTLYEDAEEETPVEDYQLERTQLAEELKQLEILGLPTSFGLRPQNSKKSKKPKEPTVHYSDFYFDFEMENECSESELEDCAETSTAEDKDDANFLHNVLEKNSSKVHKKKRNRKLKNVPAFILEEKGLLKYWRKRFSLFSRFDEGIRLDRESWFSVTPEKVAKHLAERLKSSVVVDGFCGSGGNAIQFALTCDKVIAIDIDPAKLEMAKHNAGIYKVSHKIEFILGDFLQLAAGGKLKADVVFLSPPWGGPKYKNKKEFDIEKYLLPVGASELVQASRSISENIALFLPRNSNINQIVKLAGIGKRCEIEHNYLDSRLVAITALYGEEILTKPETN